jgi:hypothetical protein
LLRLLLLLPQEVTDKLPRGLPVISSSLKDNQFQ